MAESYSAFISSYLSTGAWHLHLRGEHLHGMLSARAAADHGFLSAVRPRVHTACKLGSYTSEGACAMLRSRGESLRGQSVAAVL